LLGTIALIPGVYFLTTAVSSIYQRYKDKWAS